MKDCINRVMNGYYLIQWILFLRIQVHYNRVRFLPKANEKKKDIGGLRKCRKTK